MNIITILGGPRTDGNMLPNTHGNESRELARALTE